MTSATTFTIGNTFEAHGSATYENAVRFAVNMAKENPAEPVRISWDRHGVCFREVFTWSAVSNDIIPYYGG